MRYATVRDLSRNPAKVIRGSDPVVIVRNGRPARLLLAFDEDTLLLNDPKVKASIDRGMRELSAGAKGKTSDEVLRDIRRRKAKP